MPPRTLPTAFALDAQESFMQVAIEPRMLKPAHARHGSGRLWRVRLGHEAIVVALGGPKFSPAFASNMFIEVGANIVAHASSGCLLHSAIEALWIGQTHECPVTFSGCQLSKSQRHCMVLANRSAISRAAGFCALSKLGPRLLMFFDERCATGPARTWRKHRPFDC